MPSRRLVLAGVGSLPLLGAGLLVVQGIYTRSRTYLTTDDAPPGREAYGCGAPLRLLVAGDSSAVGVGATSAETSVAGRLATVLAERAGPAA